MLTAARALQRNAQSGRPLPRIDALASLYALPCTPRHGEFIMIAGRSGAMKSALALWWVLEMGLPTIYFSADSSGATSSYRVPAMVTGTPVEMVQKAMDRGDGGRFLEAVLEKASHIQFAFDSPITERLIDAELAAYVELWDAFPQVIVLDNLMDFEGAQAGDYGVQMAVTSYATELARETGATVMLLHHASGKREGAINKPWAPPPKWELKNGLDEKPEMILTVALDGSDKKYRIAAVKQRDGESDESASKPVALQADPSTYRFYPLQKLEESS